jgi:hypothetical protein
MNEEDILEMWLAKVVVSKINIQQQWDMHQLANIVTDLQSQVSTLKKRMN